MRILITIVAVLILSACSRGPVDGAVYVIRGDGNITRAASIDVYALPFSSVNEFNIARSTWKQDANTVKLSAYQEEVCSTLPNKISSLLQRKSDEAKQFSVSCAEETSTVDDLKKEKLMPSSINQITDQKTQKRSAELARLADKLEKDAHDAVNIRFDYNASSFGSVFITNNSNYWLTTGVDRYPESLAGFVDGIRVWSCRPYALANHNSLAPNKTREVTLGTSCSFSSEKSTLEYKGAEICKRGKYDNVLCLDDFGIEEYASSVPGNYRKGGWVFATQTAKETPLEPTVNYSVVDFLSLAKETSVIVEFDRDLKKLSDQSIISQKVVNRLERCETVNKEISKLKSVSCPVDGSDRKELNSFVDVTRSLGVKLEDVPLPSSIDIESFVDLKAVEKVRTNVEGFFALENPPKGKFLLYARYRDNFIDIDWLVPVEGDAKSLELNNSNSR